ncbi:MAG: ABC-F family ATP-binding cassette domain-containing protein [Bradymonadaceae bacterium]|nr:ABC-F family ATP-binding cassette domain-containing protein [Lujinxingiaceae bacterium]
MIRLDSLSKSFGGKPLFRDLDWIIPDNRIVGLVGPNGVGKSTLFKIIIGLDEADSGTVVRPRDLRVGYLPQELTGDEQGSLLEIILRGRQDLLDMERRLAEIETSLANDGAQTNEALSHEYGTLQELFRQRDGYAYRSRAREIAVGIGFSNQDFERSITTFSGGWQMRALLCRLLLQRPDILLLDEPTNHLDLESLEWLEGYLANYPGTIVIISHDRYFLNRLVNETAEMLSDSLVSYKGNYDAYLVEREVRRTLLIAQSEQQKKEIEKVERFVERFRYKATKSAQVQSRVKQLDKIDIIEVPPEHNARIAFRFPQPPRLGKVVLDARGLAKSYGDNVVFRGLDFQLFRGDRVAIVGPNGAGKTTLLKILAGALEADEGQIEYGNNVELTYFAQHSADKLDLSRTILDELEASASFDAAPRVRSILGAFLFRGDEVDKRISVLSGGEKSRLALAKMLLEPAGCLLLDEPTNHLDIPSRQVLEHALKGFEGAFLVVSHDRYFLNEVVTKVIHVENGAMALYEGDYDYYRWKRAQDQQFEPGASSASDGRGEEGGAISRKDQRRLAAELRKRRNDETRELRKTIEALERQIETLEARQGELERKLASPETYDASTDVGALHQEYGRLQATLEQCLQGWEEQGAALEAIDARYAREEAELGIE